MKTKVLIEINKEKILPELFEWADTFYGELDEDGEPTDESFDVVYSLAVRLENGKCNVYDYKNILFHIYQINYNEIKIAL